MIFEEKHRKTIETGSDRIFSTANDTPIEQKLKWPLFDEFGRKIPKVTRVREKP
jgi:hypothetical protein